MAERSRDERIFGVAVMAGTAFAMRIPVDLEMFERYRIEQSTGLLNSKPPAEPDRAAAEIGWNVNAAVYRVLKGESSIPGDQ